MQKDVLFDRETAAELIRLGELAKASELLKDAIQRTSDESIRFELQADLAMLFVKQSRYFQAFDVAETLDNRLKLSKIPFWMAICFATFLSFSYRFKVFWPTLKHFSQIFIRIFGATASYRILEGVLWGTYWQNMRRALVLNILSVLSSETREQEMRSIAFLNYTIAFLGYGSIGIIGFNKVLLEAEKSGQRELTRDLLVWLAVINQMNSRPAAAFQIHEQLAALFPDSEAFFQIISFASQLNTSVAELSPSVTSEILEKCFSASFALKASRNHIQIYGAKAALAALEGRTEEAVSFLERSKDAAEQNSNNLDFLIFHRLSALVYLCLEDPQSASRHIQFAHGYLAAYAPVKWYRHELSRLQMIADFQALPHFGVCWALTSKFLLSSVLLFNFDMFKKSLRISFENFKSGVCSYWPYRESLIYLKSKLIAVTKNDSNLSLEKITLKLTRVLIESSINSPEQALNFDSLRCQVTQIFGDCEVISSDDLNGCLQIVRKKYGLSNSFILNEEGQTLKAVSKCGKHLIAVRLPYTDEESEKMALGVLSQGFDLVEHELVELALRIICALFVANQNSEKIRTERVENKKKSEIAQIASQVAHDIRSPLTALEAVSSVAKNLDPESRKLLMSASKRIRDIAEDLLRYPREDIIAENQRASVSTTNLNVAEELRNLISEKKLEHKNRIGIEFKVDIPEVFSARPQLEMKNLSRALSNIINNAVEAISEKGVISISAKAVENKLTISIQDDGIGMSKEILAQSSRLGFSYGKSSGKGFGLSYAKDLAEKSNGTLSVSSEPGIGTKVVLSFCEIC